MSPPGLNMMLDQTWFQPLAWHASSYEPLGFDIRRMYGWWQIDLYQQWSIVKRQLSRSMNYEDAEKIAFEELLLLVYGQFFHLRGRKDVNFLIKTPTANNCPHPPKSEFKGGSLTTYQAQRPQSTPWCQNSSPMSQHLLCAKPENVLFGIFLQVFLLLRK